MAETFTLYMLLLHERQDAKIRRSESDKKTALFILVPIYEVKIDTI